MCTLKNTGEGFILLEICIICISVTLLKKGYFIYQCMLDSQTYFQLLISVKKTEGHIHIWIYNLAQTGPKYGEVNMV